MTDNRYLLILGIAASLLLAGLLFVVLLSGGVETAPAPGGPDRQLSPDARLPANWDSLESDQKVSLNYHHCLPRDTISQKDGRCLIGGDSGNELEAEYIYVSTSGPHAGDPLPQIRRVYVAVPDTATDEQVGRVFDNYVASEPAFADLAEFRFDRSWPDHPLGLGGQLRMVLLVVYNYSDVEFGDYYHGREFTGEPRAVYATGPGGVSYTYDYFSPVVLAAGRNDSYLPANCIAIDLQFTILSDSTVDQLRAYYSADSPFQTALDTYLGLGGAYGLEFPESAIQKRSRGDVNYDILINLFWEDPKEYYLRNYSVEDEIGVLSRHPDLPSIPLNGCQ